MDRLTILTLNTGKHAYAVRDKIGDFQIELWLPSIDAEGGRAPMVPGLALTFLFPRVGEARANGGAMFQVQPVHRQDITYMVGVAAWLESEADKTWRMAMDGYEALHLSLSLVQMYRYPPLVRPPLPWCLLMRTPLLSTCPQGQLSGIEKALPSLVWALIESGSGPE